MSIEFINHWTALGTLLMQLVGIVLLGVYFLRNKFTDLQDIAVLIEKWGLSLGFLLTFGAAAMSLYYSEVLGVAPCSLCWLQRVFLYPQVILFALALWKKDRGVAVYSIALSAIGALVGLYQHLLQMGIGPNIPCPANAADAVDCHVRFLFEFGYLTFPLMSATIFGFLILLMLYVRTARE